MKIPGIFFTLTIVLFFAACKNNETGKDTRNDLLFQIDTLGSIKLSPENADSLRSAWMALYQNPKIEKDTLLFAKVNYFLARFYGMQNNDSASLFVQKALELIEPTTGNQKEKTLIYNGMGMICNQKTLEHQENYYYNKAANILLADSTVDLSPNSKAGILLSAAQSNKLLYQPELSMKMNRAALEIAEHLPPGNTNIGRALVQITQLFLRNKNIDSVQLYVEKIEKLYNDFPESYNTAFLHELKANYYYLKKDYGNALEYLYLKEKRDRQLYLEETDIAVNINNYYVTLINIAITLDLIKESKQASAYLKKAEAIEIKHIDLIDNANKILYYEALSAWQSTTGRHIQALETMNKAFELEKEHTHSENSQAVAEMGSIYQLAAKDQSINRLNENIKINALELKQNKLWLIISVLAFTLLFLLSAFIYYRNKQQRQNQEREKTLIQQQLLRTQMEPHFIFNTLGALQSFVRFDQKESALKYLSQFGRLLRSSLELSREQTVPLGDEIEALENYLNLQQMRFDNGFSYRIHIPEEEDIELLMLPPMLIQPFVENAIIHGIDINTKEAEIVVRIILKNKILEVSISDTGKKQAGNEILTGTSLSGKITHERIRLLGKNAGIETTTNQQGGRTVTLQIPVS